MEKLNYYRSISHEELTKQRIVYIYEEMMSGIRKALPPGTWEQEKNVIIIYRYVLEIKLKLDFVQIPKINKSVIKNNKLWGSVNCYKSIKRIIHLVYPNKYNEFDFWRVPTDYWKDINNIRNRLEAFLKQDGLSIEDIPNVITCEKLIDWGFSNPLKRWGHSPYNLMNALYPNMFTYTDFKKVPQGYSTNKELLIKQFKEMLEKENISFENVPKEVTQKMLLKHRFSVALKHCNGSPSKFIQSLFPNKFLLQDFNTPNSYWKIESNVRSAINKLLQEKNIPHREIPKVFTKQFLKENELYGLLQEFHASPIELVMKLYPNDFDVTEFQRVPNKYWYEKDHRIQALRNFCKKRDIKREEIPSLTRAYFRKYFPRFISMVDRHYDSKFYLWIVESFPEYEFSAEEFQMLVGIDGQICDSKEELAIHNYLIEILDSHYKVRREDFRFLNPNKKEVYIPDWIIYKGSQKYIVEYFGLYGCSRFPDYTNKVNRKIDFYKALTDYTFIPIMPEDFRNVGFDRIESILSGNGLLPKVGVPLPDD